MLLLNTQRAQEIAASPNMVNVTCNGVQVYIQNVDSRKETARIFPINEPQKETEVSLSELSEH